MHAIFQGPGRRNALAGSCSLSIASVPARSAAQIEALVLLQALPEFLRWLQAAERKATEDPKNVFFWVATLVNGKLSYSTL